MVPWSQLRQPCLGWMRTNLTSELTHFNLVIRLGKVKPLALPLPAFFLVLPLPLSLENLWSCISTWLKLFRTTRNSNFWPQLKLFAYWHGHAGNRHVLFLQVWSLWFLVRLNMLCNLIRWNLNSCLCPCGLIWPRSRLGVTRDWLGLNWVLLI